jgi:hypothetical protein
VITRLMNKFRARRIYKASREMLPWPESEVPEGYEILGPMRMRAEQLRRGDATDSFTIVDDPEMHAHGEDTHVVRLGVEYHNIIGGGYGVRTYLPHERVTVVNRVAPLP